MERDTNQRRQILEILDQSYNHPTIKELYELVKKKYPNIGQATIYRTINKLVKDNQIKRIDCVDGIHYDKRKDHIHFYCLSCSTIKDIYINNDLIDKILLTTKDEILKINLVLEGYCTNCKNKERR